uniref:Rac GTPase-activating protein 1 n=1 Tax=Oncorhynchus kisutch TaxID=8019 RepID=A0A8C7IC23_ONCKI
MESTVLNLHNHFQNLCACSDILNEGLEPPCKEVLTKTETETGALEIKLKHVRNQVDVEIRRRQRAEAEYEKLVGKQFIRLPVFFKVSFLLKKKQTLLLFCTPISLPVWPTNLCHQRPSVPSPLLTQVIRSEFCVPCGRKTKFGKLYLRCQDCRLVAHPECRDRCTLPCNPISTGSTPSRIREPSTLADYAPSSSPMIPALVVHCVKEIEHRGLHEMGLYRVSGEGHTVKELKQSFLQGRTVPVLAKVEDIHCVTGLLKNFLRNLPEPLLTFRLNRDIMEAAEIQDNGNSLSMIYQTISELPHPNRDTLAYLSIHLQRVAQCVLDTKMDITNLARVFGPTLVGHAVPDPDPMTILHDTNRQPRVMGCLLALPYEYWSQFTVEQHTHPDDVVKDDANCYNTPDHKVSMLGPVTTPEHQMTKTPSSSSLSQRMKQTFSSTTM